jgi:hypothetical protein
MEDFLEEQKQVLADFIEEQHELIKRTFDDEKVEEITQTIVDGFDEQYNKFDVLTVSIDKKFDEQTQLFEDNFEEHTILLEDQKLVLEEKLKRLEDKLDHQTELIQDFMNVIMSSIAAAANAAFKSQKIPHTSSSSFPQTILSPRTTTTFSATSAAAATPATATEFNIDEFLKNKDPTDARGFSNLIEFKTADLMAVTKRGIVNVAVDIIKRRFHELGEQGRPIHCLVEGEEKMVYLRVDGEWICEKFADVIFQLKLKQDECVTEQDYLRTDTNIPRVTIDVFETFLLFMMNAFHRDTYIIQNLRTDENEELYKAIRSGYDCYKEIDFISQILDLVTVAYL